MKFFCTTCLKITACISICLITFLDAAAQTNTASPYSRYGIGLSRSAGFNGSFGLSGTGYAWRPSNYKPEIYDSLARSGATFNDRNSNYINVINPASFSNFSLTTYEAGFISRTVQYENETQNQQNTFASFSHLSIGFPIGERWGMAFGIKPFSQIGYDYQRNSDLNGTAVSFDYSGSGGLNEVFMGTAYQLSRNLSVGINGKFIFGEKTEVSRIVYGSGFNNFFNTLDQSVLRFNDFSFDLGLQYYRNLQKNRRLIAGFTASPIADINAEQNRLVRSYQGNEGFEQIKDTSFLDEGTTVSVNMGARYGVGIGYEKKSKWILMLDYTLIDRENASLSNNAEATDDHRISAGFEKFTSQSAFDSFIKRLGYRLGAHYNSALVRVDGVNIDEFGMSFGIAVPLRKTFSTLNFSVEVGQRGSTQNNLVREQFINFHFGVTINDKWFVKRKYD